MNSIDVGLPMVGPFSWLTQMEGLVVTSQVPIRKDGTVETGSMQDQARLTLANLRASLAAAGGDLKDVLHVTVYLTDLSDAQALNEQWTRFFEKPYPARAVVGCSGLTHPGMRIELTALAWLSDQDKGESEQHTEADSGL